MSKRPHLHLADLEASEGLAYRPSISAIRSTSRLSCSIPPHWRARSNTPSMRSTGLADVEAAGRGAAAGAAAAGFLPGLLPGFRLPLSASFIRETVSHVLDARSDLAQPFVQAEAEPLIRNAQHLVHHQARKDQCFSDALCA
jgi:hypothetical protein